MTVGSVLTAVLLLAAAYFVITAIAGIGIDTIVEELQKAETSWLLAGLVTVPLVPVAQSFGTIGASILPLRLGPVIALEYAIQFIALAVPSSAARVAVNVRFFQRQGAPTTQALTIGLLDSLFGFVVQVILLVTILLSGLATLDLSSPASNRPDRRILVLAGILVVVAWSSRSPSRGSAGRSPRGSPRRGRRSGSIRSPIKLAGLFGGNFVAQLLLAVVLGFTVIARAERDAGRVAAREHARQPVRGLHAVPGGIGVSEAALLLSGGDRDPNRSRSPSPSSIGSSRSTCRRSGAGSMRWLKRHDYL